MNASAAILWITLAATGTSTPPSGGEKKESFGAVVGPAALPAGATAAYAFIGLPEVGAGFRQGLGFGEWEARARVDYLTLSATAELVGKYALYHWGKLDYGPFLGAGVTLSSGSRYFDPYTFTYAGLRALGGVTLTYRVIDTLQILARLEVPFDWALGTGGGGRLRALAGGGVELYLSDDVSATALGEIGMDWIKQPLGVTVGRLGYTLVLGVGYRLF